jgi:hypothetical protein
MNPPPLPVAPPAPKSSALMAGWICVAIGFGTFWIFGLGFAFFSIAMLCAIVAMCTNQVQRWPHTLAVELCIARHLRRHFLRRYLWGYVWRIWASSSESSTTADSFCVADPIVPSSSNENSLCNVHNYKWATASKRGSLEHSLFVRYLPKRPQKYYMLNQIGHSTVGELQEQHERWVGDRVIEWYNSWEGTSFTFKGRCGAAPDLEYRDGSHLLRIEVVTAYYDKEEDAKFRWLHARNHPEAPHKWSGVNFEKSLVENITSAIAAKCGKSYGANCLLAVCVLPSLTFADEMKSLLDSIAIPAANPFQGVYLCGQFPAPIPHPAQTKVWRLAP